MKRSQLAINSISTKHANLEEALAAYAEAGFHNVEFAIGHVKAELGAGKSIADVRRMLDAHGLQCIGGFEIGIEAFSMAESRKRNHDHLIENARLLAELGGTNMVVGTDGPQNAGDDVIAPLAEALGEVAGRIADMGVKILIEFNWSPVVKSLRTAAEIARRSGAPNAGVLFDPAHYHCTPSKFDQLNAENIAFIKHVHVDDMRDKPGELSDCNGDRALPGQGHLDLAALFGKIEEHGYKGYFSIEMFSDELWALPASEAAAKMYQSLLPLCED